MKNTLETKLNIIENYIDWVTSDESERERMKQSAYFYVTEDHVDEIEQTFIFNSLTLKPFGV